MGWKGVATQLCQSEVHYNSVPPNSLEMIPCNDTTGRGRHWHCLQGFPVGCGGQCPPLGHAPGPGTWLACVATMHVCAIYTTCPSAQQGFIVKIVKIVGLALKKVKIGNGWSIGHG